MFDLFRGAVALAFIFGALQVHGESGRTSAKNTADKKIGLYVGIGNPYPTLLGLNAAYNVTRDLRASIGYGEVEVTSSLAFNGSTLVEEKISAKTYSIGAEYLFFDSAVRGIVGTRAAYFQVSGKGDIDLDGFDKSTGYLYSNLGMDYISAGGFHIGSGFNVAYLGASGTGFYLNSGWFF